MPNKYQNEGLEGVGIAALLCCPVQTIVVGMGVGGFSASHASGYWHPVTFTGASPVSWELYHPFPPTIFVPFVALNVGTGNVGTEPVDVYVGSPATSGISASEVGGQLPNDARNVGTIVPGPPPVTEGAREPGTGKSSPAAAHTP